MEDNKQPQKKQLSIELTEEQAQGTYANLAIISHSGAEFVFDFTRILPGVPKAKVQSRIIMTPQHAKMLARALNDNINKFESQNGEIKIDGNNPGDLLSGFPDNPKIN